MVLTHEKIYKRTLVGWELGRFLWTNTLESKGVVLIFKINFKFCLILPFDSKSHDAC